MVPALPSGQGPPLKGLVIAGTASSSGKTSVALGVMAALRRRGLSVQAFKVGPDFIDPGLHGLATGRDGQNLDGWMLSRETNLDIFARAAHGVDVAVVEGVMGLYDGASPTAEAGSTAEMAKWLGLPVLLVVDAGAMARSAAALVQGFVSFDPQLSFVGVVFNKVGSKRHGALLTQAVGPVAQQLPGARVWGFLPKRAEVALPSRHLGLVTAQETIDPEGSMTALARWVEESLPLDAILAVLPDKNPPLPVVEADQIAPEVRLAVARDAAFCFHYAENLRLLQAAGAELAFFSPMKDRRLPEQVHGLYLGGGYPEAHAFELANNARMRREVAAFCASGRPVLAECGGFMYLMQSLETLNGQVFPMCGVFPLRAAMTARRTALGYRQIVSTRQSLLGPAGTTLRGHEFHYSAIPEPAYDQASMFTVTDRDGLPVNHGAAPPGLDGFGGGDGARGVVASYIHMHFGSSPQAARTFVQACAMGSP